MPDDTRSVAALAGWNKVLSLHLHLMLAGYETGQEWDQGEIAVGITLFGRMRALIGRSQAEMHLSPGSSLEAAMRKFFHYYPQARAEALDPVWEAGERVDALGVPWMTVDRAFRPRSGWRVLINGRDSAYLPAGGRVLKDGDTVQIFPPGR